MKLRTFGDSDRLHADRRDLVDRAGERQVRIGVEPDPHGLAARSSSMSAWFTLARTRIVAGLTTSTTGTPARTSSPSWISAMLPPFQVVLMTAMPAIGDLISIRSAFDAACLHGVLPIDRGGFRAP